MCVCVTVRATTYAVAQSTAGEEEEAFLSVGVRESGMFIGRYKITEQNA